MCTMHYNGKTYNIDMLGFIKNFTEWDEDFAEGTAKDVKIENGLTERHWGVIKFIRDVFYENARCPSVYQACRMNGLRLRGFKELFPTGYLRGACKLAGITYRQSAVSTTWLGALPQETAPVQSEKIYRVDLFGFLIDPDEWDEHFCKHKANETKMFDEPTEKHWQVILHIRDCYKKNKVVPTVIETCEANGIDLEELERLFPDGYHRGAVKLAGLRVK
ncbi:MAG: TusE/DsrC/DsvC family sulfur relay protein [Candidatus Electryonea clarkiae]|nr:TusE/DsrC/DsvC family sulfur relay protein [Candidatus Electryonea clarkiae]MDP8287041.1 TusE/DsrC/DsvC family sulfur relay protein [Candidatus Electryonea clarkiae]